MPEQIFIKPNEGRRVRLETGCLLPEEGAEVVHTTYIQRRILDEDVSIIERPMSYENEIEIV